MNMTELIPYNLSEFDILKTNANGEIIVNSNIDDLIETFEYYKTLASENLDKLRAALLTAMQANNIYTLKLRRHNISQVCPKDIETFDVDAFLLSESLDVVQTFATISETKTFDIERFKTEQPEMYDKYCTVEQSVKVDTKKLEKALPTVYRKYTTVTKSDKPVTIRIAKVKE